MGKLPSTILRRPSLAGTGSYLSSTTSTSHNASHTILPSPSQCATPSITTRPHGQVQVRHATFVPRPRRPYEFTQLVQLSDGSTFTVRTTSPLALYKSAKDSRNHILWQPSEKSLKNVEVDEAGKLAAFRERYGNAWDLGAPSSGSAAATAAKPDEAAAAAKAAAAPGAADKKAAGQEKTAEEAKPTATQASAPTEAAPAAPEDQFDSLVDLISAYATEDKNVKGGLSAKDQAKKDKSGKKK
ncbi:hypothetical protein C8A03DRAFT_31720 [Achaetomium macrosporum]|uniref:Ribosomal protein bL31m N-terminal domain-containing protein n=1 Tax=Achaetomium macrosporum TaxID=79813 RepID=A0AAN7HDV4_9PEZI|nr:hypothetical protein C8A03DRAFT_31720 [Achaetomium macrosporum]